MSKQVEFGIRSVYSTLSTASFIINALEIVSKYCIFQTFPPMLLFFGRVQHAWPGNRNFKNQ